MQILIVYHSDYGSTEKLAQAIAAGAAVAAPGADVKLQQAQQTALTDLSAADVLIFGTPVHMGSMCWQMKQLIDNSARLWMEGALEGKIGAAFVTGGGFGGSGGGAEQTLIALHSNFLEHGMITIGFPKSLPGYADGGLQWGACARTGNHEGMPAGIQDAALVAGRSYGMHIASMATQILNNAG